MTRTDYMVVTAGWVEPDTATRVRMGDQPLYRITEWGMEVLREATGARLLRTPGKPGAVSDQKRAFLSSPTIFSVD